MNNLLAVMGRASHALRSSGHAYEPLLLAMAEVATIIEERDRLRVVARDFDEALAEERSHCECGQPDCRTTRLRAALAKVQP